MKNVLLGILAQLDFNKIEELFENCNAPKSEIAEAKKLFNDFRQKEVEMIKNLMTPIIDWIEPSVFDYDYIDSIFKNDDDFARLRYENKSFDEIILHVNRVKSYVKKHMPLLEKKYDTFFKKIKQKLDDEE